MDIKNLSTVFGVKMEFPLRVRHEIKQSPTEWHKHEFVELVVVTHGSGIHETSYSKAGIQPGDVFAIPRSGRHRYVDTDNLNIMNILFEPKELPMPWLDLYKLPGYSALFVLEEKFFSNKRPYPHFRMTPEQFEGLSGLLHDLNFESNNTTDPGYRFCSLGLFMALLGKLSRLYSNNHIPAKNSPFSIGKTISYLNSHYEEEVELKNLLKFSGMSKSTFLRSFMRATGTTPVQYLLNIRIIHACQYLQNTEQSVSEISTLTGFNDSSYFARVFKKAVGVSPSDFRQHGFKPS